MEFSFVNTTVTIFIYSANERNLPDNNSIFFENGTIWNLWILGSTQLQLKYELNFYLIIKSIYGMVKLNPNRYEIMCF